MTRCVFGSLLVLGLLTATASAQTNSSGTGRTTTGTAIPPRTNLIINEESPSDWVSSDLTNPRTTTGTTTATTPNTRLPISANVAMDDQEHLERYQREYDARRWSMARAQQEREMRQMRLELRKFYGVSLSRPAGSPMMMGGTYAPNWIGGWNTAYGLPGQYPAQNFYFQVR